MILDTVENLKNYLPLLHCASLEKLLEEWKGKPVGCHEAGDNSGVYVMVQEGMTDPLAEKLFEAHRRYVDVHVLLRGEEVLEWAPLGRLALREEYDAERDVAFFDGEGVPLGLRPGQFCVTFPLDGHKPCCHTGAQAAYRKLVVKIPVEPV